MMRILSLVLVTATAAVAALPQNPPAKNPPPAPTPAQNPPPKNPAPAPQNPRPGAENPADARGAAMAEDALFATWVLIGSNNIATIAQLAQQKASDPEVKQLAQKMEADHKQLSQRLQSFSGSAARGGVGSTERPAGERPAGKAEEASAGRPGDFDHVGLARELGDECLASARKELESKSGSDFDRCYVGSVIGAHMGAKDMLTVFQRHASAGLKPVLGDAATLVNSHLEHAKELAKKMEGKHGDTKREPVGGK